MTMDPRFFTYGEAVCRQVRHATKREKAGIQKELADHLMDHTEALVAAGYTPQDAQDLALDAMGDPVQVGPFLSPWLAGAGPRAVGGHGGLPAHTGVLWLRCRLSFRQLVGRET